MMKVLYLLSTTVAFGQAIGQMSPSVSGAPQQTIQAQSPANANIPDNPQPATSEDTLRGLPAQLLHDQITMWSSPARAKFSDTTWLVPLGGFAAALFATDANVSTHLSNSPDTILRYRHISDYGAYSMVGGAGGLYLLGLATDNAHQRETGFLSGEAAVDSLAVVELLKYTSRRQRPYQGTGTGPFRQGGTSFPSEHSAITWSIAGIVAHEYPSPFMKFMSYGLATAVSASRITAKQHFPSDVLVGMALGYLTSEYVYRRHHNPDLPGESWETPAIRPDRPSHWQAKNIGSPYVPLDSWIYPALDRLTALGYVHTGFADMRPWTRMECARQLQEAEDFINQDNAQEGEAARIYSTLEEEFSHEESLLGGGNNAELRLESAYTRATEIAGKPLTDGDHFGQTIINDYGRPEEQGFNNVTGLSGWAADGPFVVYARGEFQHSPSAPALPFSAREAISQGDFSHTTVPAPFPVPPNTPISAVNQVQFLDAYVAMNVSDWQFSFGNQSLWWGPEQAGPLMFSNNAAPLRMFRANRVTPFTLPSFLGVLGPMRIEAFLGQFSGYEFVFTPNGLVGNYGRSLNPQPIIHGERISFKPTQNLEIGLSRTTDYGGPGYPLTLHTFARSLFSTGNSNPGTPNKPGSRRSGIDFSYRIPGLRNGLTLYGDGLAEHDEISPLLGPNVAAWIGGVYLPRLPKLPKLDLRLEGGYTNPPTNAPDVSFGNFYTDSTWITGFQNSGNLMGSWVGRQGDGLQASSTYWFSPRNKLQFGFRRQTVSHEFIPDGGNLTDASVRSEFWLRSYFSVSASVQYETWNFPVIASTRQSNVSTSIQLTFWPKALGVRAATQQ